MRISDWSSDVCSSDLLFGAGPGRAPRSRQGFHRPRRGAHDARGKCRARLPRARDDPDDAAPARGERRRLSRAQVDRLWRVRSEEHTSELQSLMRISYAVFCLKKKIKPQIIDHEV